MITDWLMIVITTAYVVATIFIYRANLKSIEAANKQIEVSKRQIEEMIAQHKAINRPFVTIRFDVIRSGLLCFIIENEGPLPAHNVQIRFNKEFLENIQDTNHGHSIEALNNASFYMTSRQKLTVVLGGPGNFDKISKEIAKIDISYDDFNEYTEIDIEQYYFLTLYSSPLEDMSQHLEKIKNEERSFHRSLMRAIENHASFQNVAVHLPAEVESNKFRIYKEVCKTPDSTVTQLAEKVGMEQSDVLNLLVELHKVDRLISCHKTADDSEAFWYRW